MSMTNEVFSTLSDDHMMPLDLRYANFLKALAEIHDEEMRDRCHKYWTSLYRYFDRSTTNERALILEEKRTREILHRLDIKMTSHQSKIAYQVRNILQRGHEVLSDLHSKYRRKKNNLGEIEGTIDQLENQIQEQKSEHSFASNSATTSSLTHVQQMTNTIDELKLQIKNLQMTRETFQTELNIKRANYFYTYIKAYQIQQNIHQSVRESIEMEHDLAFNVQTIDERSRELNQFRLYKQSLSISINQKQLDINSQLLGKQIEAEQERSFAWQAQNQALKDKLCQQMVLFKTNQSKQSELQMNNRDLCDKIHSKEKQIEEDKQIKHELSQIFLQLEVQLNSKEKIFSIKHREEKKLKNLSLELEHNRDMFLQHPPGLTPENFNQSIDDLKKTIHQEVKDRLKLTLHHQNLKNQIHTLDHQTEQYAFLVKDQRQQVLRYEKLHDKWIYSINTNRIRLIELLKRVNLMEEYINNTHTFLEHFDGIKLSNRPGVLIIYNQMNSFLQQRREKNDVDANISIRDIGKSSLNIKLRQMRRMIQSNQTTIDQMKQKIILVQKIHSILLDQISTINKQRSPILEQLDFLRKKSLVEQQRIFNIRNQLDQIKHSRDFNHQRFERSTLERRHIIVLFLRKQHLITLVTKRLAWNRKNLIKHRFCYNQLLKKIDQIQRQVKHETKRKKFLTREDQVDLKDAILSFRKQLLEYRKKNTDLQHRLNRRHLTQQILTKFNNKSIEKENTRITFEQKASSIIYRLICKTHSNILLHKRFDLLLENLLLVQTSTNFSTIHICHASSLNNQVKSSTAELRVLKHHIVLYQQIYSNLKYDYVLLCEEEEKARSLIHDEREIRL